MKTQTISTYQFDELSDEAKEKAREWWREGGFDYDWYDFIFEDAKTIGALMGIQIDNIYFSGFWSQGDGACFEGSYEYKAGSVKAVKEYAPQDTKLHRIAKGLSKAQRPHFYGATAHVKHSGRYNHEMCTDISVYGNKDLQDYYVDADTHDQFAELLRDFMRWIYKRLEQEYNWLNSDECVDETILCNEYEFTESGSRCVCL